MARTALVEKANREPKFSTRKYSRCKLCGRARGYMRDFGLCRHCFRKLARDGKIPGITRSSW